MRIGPQWSNERTLRRAGDVDLSRRVGLGFDRRSIAGLTGWWSAWHLHLADGDSVGTWPDLSGNGNDLAQGTGAKQPTYVDAAIGGIPSVRFRRADSQIMTVTFGSSLSQPNTIIMAGQCFPSYTKNATVLDGVAAGDRHALFWTNTDAEWRLYSGTTVDSTVAATAPWHIFSMRFDSGSPNTVLRVDGSTVTGPTDAGADALGGLTVGARFTDDGYTDADISEILVVDGALTDAELSDIETQIDRDYGIL